ncbi:MAG: KpsF/GutQ family sugar-phosphate isomerase [Acidobacteriaceae bacterium]|nr:KpsF/GutQ family sugar-phosphate isomerase [Acidobacteriaceae bacterium]
MRLQTSTASNGFSESLQVADYARVARNVLTAEAEALLAISDRLDRRFTEAVDLILSCGGKVVVTGLGKSGHIAHKMAATFCSTGTTAIYLHAVEARHGDLGVYCERDPTILVSKSGATKELIELVPMLRALGSPLIGILGNLSSPLAALVDIVLDARVDREADEFDIVPSSSSTAAIGLGDALAIALMHARHFGQNDFARYHPSGQLGRNLWLSVADVMHHAKHTACVGPGDRLRDVVIAMTRYPLGAACVVHTDGSLAGIITDGDLRRTLQEHEDIRALTATDVMTLQPVTITPGALLKQAEVLMEARESQISVLPVVNEENRYLGLVRVHDLYPRD